MKLLTQIIVFCGVGVINTLSCLLIIYTLSHLLGVHYIVSNVIGYGTTMVMGFYMHRQITFRAHNQHQTVQRQIAGFIFVSGLAYICQLGLLFFLVEFAGVSEMTAQIVSIILFVAISFTGNKFITFSTRNLS